jgi:putative YphP/YqiW family bacilliredoxin
MMYPEDLVLPMKHDLTVAGFEEVVTAEAVETTLNAEGTTLIVINSVCGCAAANARPAAKMSLAHPHTPDRIVTAFAGFDIEAVNKAREMMVPFPPSSPCMALFKDGELVHMIERHHIEGRPAQMIADNLKGAYDEFCA